MDSTSGVEDIFNEGPVVGYIGFDPTAPSLTIGNFVQVMLLSFFQRTGNKPIVLMDEPFSALDVITRLKLQTLAAKLLKNRTVLFVTHDPFEALRLANKIMVMHGEPVNLQPIFDLKNGYFRNG